MIILPDKNICATKFLISVPKKEWMPSSQTITKDQFGNDTFRTRFRVRARLNDGFVKWTGWFDDRNDMDAFLWSIAKGTLKHERHLWDLSLPSWNPDLGENLSYDFLTIQYLSGVSGTYNRPVDWNATNNVAYAIAGGGGGGRGNNTNVPGRGGAGGGACSGTANLDLSASVSYQVGGAGIGGTAQPQAGTPGGDSWFNAPVSAPSYANANPASKGGLGSGSQTGALGGDAAAGIGSARFSGGNGGNGQGTNGAGGGGGGAAGQNAGGGNGTNGASGNGGNGGAGNGGIGGGGAGATPDGGTGGAGTNFGSPYGSGGGAGGGGSSVTAGGPGGSYGGGGGGGRTTSTGSASGGSGSPGFIYIHYEPIGLWTNIAMLGM